MGYLRYKGYSGSVEYSEADDCLFGKVQGMDKDCISYEGETLSGLRHDFEEAVDAYLESCKERGVIPRRPFSGRLVLRMSSELHGRVAFAAAGLGTTINEFINRSLVDELDCLGINLKSSATTKL